MARSAMSLDNEVKNTFYNIIIPALENAGYEVLKVPLTESSESRGFKISIPTVDAERNDKSVIIEISVPRKKKDGTEYNPYEENERYKFNVEQQDAKERARKEKAEREEAEKKRRREVRKTVKNMKKEVEEIFTSEEKGE